MQEPTLIKKTLSTTPKLNSLISKSVDFLLTPDFSTSSVFYATYHVDIFGPLPPSCKRNLWIPLVSTNIILATPQIGSRWCQLCYRRSAVESAEMICPILGNSLTSPHKGNPF